MAIRFKEIKRYLARNVRLSICFEDLSYRNYLMISDIHNAAYDNLYVYGVGIIDSEFSADIYSETAESESSIVRDYEIRSAIEIVLHKVPRDIERKAEDCLLFRDLKPYLQIGWSFTVINRNKRTAEEYEYRDDIPAKYDEMYVYGIGMEDNYSEDNFVKAHNFNHDTVWKKRMVLALSDKPRSDISGDGSICSGPFFLLVTADDWNHDADEWLGIYTGRKEAAEAYDRAAAWWKEEQGNAAIKSPQRVAMFEYIAEEDRFREVKREELGGAE